MFIWTDIETTGLDSRADKILALGIIITDDSFAEIARREWLVRQDQPLVMSDFVRAMHTKSGLLARLPTDDAGLYLDEVEALACEFIDRHTPLTDDIKARPCMAGNSVAFDREFIREQLPDLHRRYHYRLLDVSALKVLACATVPGARAWNDSRSDAAHTPLADLEASIDELQHWREVLVEAAVSEAVEPWVAVAKNYRLAVDYLPGGVD